MQSFAQFLDAAKEYCQGHVTEASYNAWLSGLEAVSFSGEEAVISAPSNFLRDMVESRYTPLLEKAFESIMGFEVKVKVVSREAMQAEQSAAPAPRAVSIGQGAYTFENFIIGQDNRFAHAAAQAVAANPANAYNPLFIHGASGLGKTHLLHAIKNQLAQTRPELRVLYIGGDSFTNELIEAIRTGSTEAFHEKYRKGVDVLLVDDVQFIGGRESTQEEFFHTFNALHDAHKQIVLTSDRPPKEIKSLEDRLRTRFEWGLTADVTPPDIETRISILQRKAKDIGFELPGEVADFIAKQLKKDIRQLEGTVKKLYAFKLMDGSEPTIELAERAISDIVSEQMPWPATVEKIISEVGRTFNVPAEDLRSNKQNSAVSNARQIAMYIIREVTGTTMEKIGQEFGGRNHSTVVYGISKVEKNLAKDAHMRAIVEDIIKNCRQ